MGELYQQQAISPITSRTYQACSAVTGGIGYSPYWQPWIGLFEMSTGNFIYYLIILRSFNWNITFRAVIKGRLTRSTCYGRVCLIFPWCYEWNCLLLIEFNHKVTSLLWVWRMRLQATLIICILYYILLFQVPVQTWVIYISHLSKWL